MMMCPLQIQLIHIKDGLEQHRKQECLKGAISKRNKYLLGGKKSGHMKTVIKQATKLLIKHMLNTSCVN